VEPRFFIPAEQRPSSATTRTFVIRAATGASGVGRAVREAFSGVDGELSSSSVDVASIEDYMSPLVADERIIARLAVVFGTVALTLAAVGLYGLLSYGVSRRSSEIAIRMALGAQRRSIVLTIARDTAGLIAAGLLAGGVLAHVASRLVENRLYGVAPHDPLNSLLAAGVLVAVAFLAAYLPARRASRIDPMAALRRE
jgi:ABC-type antimicrobial peptide transport system permease subunit